MNLTLNMLSKLHQFALSRLSNVIAEPLRLTEWFAVKPFHSWSCSITVCDGWQMSLKLLLRMFHIIQSITRERERERAPSTVYSTRLYGNVTSTRGRAERVAWWGYETDKEGRVIRHKKFALVPDFGSPKTRNISQINVGHLNRDMSDPTIRWLAAPPDNNGKHSG